MVTVRFSKGAVRDLNEMFEFVAQEDSGAASRLINVIEERCAELAELPFLGRPRPEFFSDVRSLFVDPFIIFYQVNGAGVTILRVYHASRDPDSVL